MHTLNVQQQFAPCKWQQTRTCLFQWKFQFSYLKLGQETEENEFFAVLRVLRFGVTKINRIGLFVGIFFSESLWTTLKSLLPGDGSQTGNNDETDLERVEGDEMGDLGENGEGSGNEAEN